MVSAMTHDSSDSSAQVVRLLNAVRDGDSESLGNLLLLYQNYLSVLAKTQLDRRLKRRLNPSDVVQETMLAAHRDFPSFRGNSEGELICWLRRILCRCLSHATEAHVYTRKRDIRREMIMIPSSASSDQSHATLAQMLPARTGTPSEAAGRRELAARLSNELAKLKPDYRDVIIYRNLQGLSFDEIAIRMDRKVGTVRMLWLRAIEKFKTVCPRWDDA